MGVRRRVGVLKRSDSTCIGVVRRGVASLLAVLVLSVDIPERLGGNVEVSFRETWKSRTMIHLKIVYVADTLGRQPPPLGPIIDRPAGILKPAPQKVKDFSPK